MMMGSQGYYDLPGIWNYLGYIGNWMTFFFLGFMGVLIITSEFANKTLRQSIINGLSRREVFLGKVLLMLTISFIATVYYYLCGAIIGAYHEPSFEFVELFDGMGIILRYMLMCFGYMTFGAFLGTLFRRTGLAVFLFLVYGIFLELILRYGVHGYFFGRTRTLLFYPLNAMEDLAPLPFSRVVQEWKNNIGFDAFLSPTEAVVTSSVYILLFLFGMYTLLTKKDL